MPKIIFLLFIWDPTARFMRPVSAYPSMAACEQAAAWVPEGRPKICGAVPYKHGRSNP